MSSSPAWQAAVATVLRGLVAASLLISVTATPARAHDVWLTLSTQRTPSAENSTADPESTAAVSPLLRVNLVQGHGNQAGDFETLARNDRRLRRLVAIAPDGSERPLPGLHGAQPAGVLRPDLEGTWTVIYESHEATHVLPAARFRRHLEEEGLDHVLEARRRGGTSEAEGRERYERSLRLLWAIGGRPIEDRSHGLGAEILVESIGPDTVELRVLFDGEPAEGALVDFHPATGAGAERLGGWVEARRSDAEGRLRIALPTELDDRRGGNGSSPLSWVATTVLTRSSGDDQVPWRTHFVATTFRAGALPDGALSDGALPDGALSDGALSDGALSDGALSDGALPDGALSDGALSDGQRSPERQGATAHGGKP